MWMWFSVMSLRQAYVVYCTADSSVRQQEHVCMLERHPGSGPHVAIAATGPGIMPPQSNISTGKCLRKTNTNPPLPLRLKDQRVPSLRAVNLPDHKLTLPTLNQGEVDICQGGKSRLLYPGHNQTSGLLEDLLFPLIPPRSLFRNDLPHPSHNPRHHDQLPSDYPL